MLDSRSGNASRSCTVCAKNRAHMQVPLPGKAALSHEVQKQAVTVNPTIKD
jgi:hypothetical protein